MADKKISALTSATTPLAGTEVLPIVQSGATVKVSIANVTAGRAVSMLSGTITDSIATPVPLTINNNNPSVAAGTRVNFQFNGSTVGYVGNQFDGGDFNNLYDASKNHIFTRGATQTMLIDNANDITVSAGNLKIGTAGKGIDFAANGGDVLNQYDEGTFTATLTCTTGTITLNSAQDLMQYTRIGRMVYVSGQLGVSSISSPTGILTLGGLPFTINGSLGELAGRGAITVVADGLAITVNNVVGYFVTGGTSATIAKYAAGNPANMAADVTAASSFFINMWYVAA